MPDTAAHSSAHGADRSELQQLRDDVDASLLKMVRALARKHAIDDHNAAMKARDAS